ncbi:hypothetical protein VM1G_02991 [Cytospora mali]|uniref:Aminoglycoside phosphotransferase domain-containing protein n=1 Tax=Cytospora mali TaxID=578113 RepID=A0A194VV05_CYTMA|nr:hypothetical protein VM1G_02991 [Valsa mali]
MQIIERAEWADMARAEFKSQEALAAIIPDNVVVPMAWGYFQDDTSKSFYLSRFRNMSAQTPPPSQLVDILSKLHQESTSPTGKFGFHCATYWGPPRIVNAWTDNWEEFWSRQFRSDIAYAQRIYGEDEELATLTEEFIQKAVARLPTDRLSYSTHAPSMGMPKVCSYVGLLDEWKWCFQIMAYFTNFNNNAKSVDFQAIGEPRYALRMNVVDIYKEKVGASEPRDDFYDRHFLYGIRNDVVVAAICPEWESLLVTQVHKQLSHPAAEVHA